MSIKWKEHPVSMTEMGIYLDGQVNPDSTAYNIPYLIKLPTGIDIERLRYAIGEVFAAHPGLFSRFKRGDGNDVIRLMPEGDPESIPVTISECDEEPDLSSLIKTFSFNDEELYRVIILHGKDTDYLFVDIHHILFDGTSEHVFFTDLDKAYRGNDIKPEKTGVIGFAEKEQAMRKTDAFIGAGQYYRGLFSDTEANSSLIRDKESGDKKNAWCDFELHIDGDLIKKFSNENNIRISTIFTAVYGYLLSRYCDADEAMYATIHSGRNEDNADTVGMFVKTYPVLQSFKPGETVAECLKELDAQIGRSRENDLFSYVDIMSELSLTIPMLTTQNDPTTTYCG